MQKSINTETEIKTLFKKLKATLKKLEITPENKDLQFLAEEIRQNIQKIAEKHPISQENICKKIIINAVTNVIILEICENKEFNEILKLIESNILPRNLRKKQEISVIIETINIPQKTKEQITQLQEIIRIKLDPTFLLPEGKKQEFLKDKKWILSNQSTQFLHVFNINEKDFKKSIMDLKNKSLENLIKKYKIITNY